MTWRYKSCHFNVVTEKLFLSFTKAGEGRAGHNAVCAQLVSEGFPSVVKCALNHCIWGFSTYLMKGVSMTPAGMHPPGISQESHKATVILGP